MSAPSDSFLIHSLTPKSVLQLESVASNTNRVINFNTRVIDDRYGIDY
jgi:hypothetical protein